VWQATVPAEVGATNVECLNGAARAARPCLVWWSLYGRQTKRSPLIGPSKGSDRVNKDLFLVLSEHVRVLTHFILLFPEVLEGLRSSGRLVGMISIYPGTFPTPCAELWPKTSWGMLPVCGIGNHGVLYIACIYIYIYMWVLYVLHFLSCPT